jgi:hypothetical protein
MVSGSCALPPGWPAQCSCVVIESSFDPGERLQAPGSLWFYVDKKSKMATIENVKSFLSNMIELKCA